jgi:hypothetical protein
MINLIKSERQKPYALELYKNIYAAHIVDPKCGLGENCPKMLELKRRIKELENEGVVPSVSWRSGVE